MTARIIGIGQSAAGDDGVGIEIVRRLRQVALPAGVELIEAVDPSALPELLDQVDRVILTDAVVGGDEPGRVLRLAPEALARDGLTPLSSHGMSVPAAIELARTLSPATVCPDIVIVGVCIAPPEPYRDRLSPAVAAAVDPAVAEVRAIPGV